MSEDISKIETVIEGLMTLGYTRGEIMVPINKINTSDMDAEEIIKEVLKNLSR